jgi:hypothetical protein
VDVAATRAVARGAEVVFVDNRAETLDGSTDLAAALTAAAELAVARGRKR